MKSMDILRYEVSAPGKVILHGEHSVVYGKTAIAASLGMRTRVKLQETKNTGDPHLTVNLPNLRFIMAFSYESLARLFNIPSINQDEEYDLENPKNIDHDEYLKNIHKFLDEQKSKYEIQISNVQFQAIAIILYVFCAIFRHFDLMLGIELTVDSDLAIGAGTGSSASYSVSLAAAMFQYLKLHQDEYYLSTFSKNGNTIDSKDFTFEEKTAISAWAFCCEKIAHGNPSGVDNATCTFGSLVQFRKGSEPIPHSFNLRLRILLVDTRVSRQTRDLIQRVVDLGQRYPDLVGSIMESLNQVALAALKVIMAMNSDTTKSLDDDYKRLSELFDINHKLLTTLNVSHPTLERIQLISAKFGFSCKLTGAGGGGFAIVLIPHDADEEVIQKLIQTLNGSGFLAKLTEVGGTGVTFNYVLP